MNIDELLSALRKIEDKSVPIYVSSDYGHTEPAELSSYRGNYRDLAIIPYNEDRSYLGDEKIKSVSEFIDKLEDIKGKSLEGYKGGEYEMTGDTPVYVSAYGYASGRYVSKVIGTLIITNIDCEE